MNPKIKNPRFGITVREFRGKTPGGLVIGGYTRFSEAVKAGFKSILSALSTKHDFDKVRLVVALECSDCTGIGQIFRKGREPSVCKGCKGDPKGEVKLDLVFTRDDVYWQGLSIVECATSAVPEVASKKTKAPARASGKAVAKKKTARAVGSRKK